VEATKDLDQAQGTVDVDLTDTSKGHGTVKLIHPDLTIRKTTMYLSVICIHKPRQRGKQPPSAVNYDTEIGLSVKHEWSNHKPVYVKPKGTLVGNGMVKAVLRRISCRPSYRLYS
jgi:hypothetical protein